MLQRAASNAYSWWRASHIRSKQSKWLDNNLEEMEDTVGNMLKLIEPNADSFAKRAELYFKRRPELIGYVEDAFRSYRALAERYDHISGELHKANHTIATSFPEHVQYAMLEEEEDGCPKALIPINPSKINKRTVEGLVNKKKEKKPPRKGKKKHKKALFNEETAREEINKLQKGILVLQTEKEFIKGSYESGIAKYWDIEKRIMEMHEQVCSLQDEFNASAVIEDDEVRSLMTATVLKSCEDTIVKLQEQRRKSLEDAKKESARTKVAREKMETLKGVNSQTEMKSAEISQGITEANLSPEKIEQEFSSVDKAISELQSLCEKITDHFEKNPESSVIEIAEKIEDLANKVITMELTVSSQTLQVNRLISENDELEKFVNSVEEEKTNPTNDSNELSKKIKEAEEELSKVQAIERTIQNEVINFHENLSETWHSLDSISEMLEPHRSVENACIANASPEEEVPILNTETQRHCEDKKATEVLLDPHRSVENACIGDASPEEEVPILNIETQRDCEDNKATGVLLDPHRSVENPCIGEATPEEQVPILSTETQRNCEDKKATEVLLDPHRSVENACIGDASPEEEVPILNIETQRDCEDNKATGVLLDPHRSVENPCIGEATPEEQVPILSTETQRNCEDKKATEVLLDPHRSVENACIGDASPEEEVPILNTETQRDCEDKKATQVDDIKEDMFYEADTTQEDDYCMGDPSQTDSGAQPKIAVVEKEPSTADLSINVTSNEQIIPDREEDSLKLQQLQSKEKILLAEYTSALENYEETKRKLSEVEKKNKEDLLEMTVLIGELKNEIAMKNEEIRLLRQPMASENKISNDTPTPDTTSHEECQPCPEKLESTSKSAVVKKKLIPLSAKRPKRLTLEKSPGRRGSSVELKQTKSSIAKGISGQWHDDSKISSPIEEKFRKEIDAQLDERLEFWLKFSTSFHHIQAFRDKYEDLQADLIKLKNKTQEANDTATTDEFGKSESAQLTTRLRQLKTELHVWLEQGALLKEDLQNRFSSLCAMQEEISSVLNTSSETGEVLFSPYQAARFQGEVMNMKKENNKIVSELKAGLDQVKGLNAEIEELLSALLFKKFEPLVPKDSSFDCLELSANRPNTVPLRDFLFGVKPKKMSILARIQQSKLKGGRLRI